MQWILVVLSLLNFLGYFFYKNSGTTTRKLYEYLTNVGKKSCLVLAWIFFFFQDVFVNNLLSYRSLMLEDRKNQSQENYLTRNVGWMIK